jgi:hypothetical protein
VSYIDSSVLPADFFAEHRLPPETFWDEDLASGQLLVYEVWTRINAPRGLTSSHGDSGTRAVSSDEPNRIELGSVGAVPVAVRTLGALHLATIDFTPETGEPVQLASYDNRLIAAARALGIALAAL